jgi:predicted aldo/keto reductase-like oxidoreductase
VAGAINALKKAKMDGRVCFLGFSAHSVEAALALMDRFSFDSIKFVTAPMPLTRT